MQLLHFIFSLIFLLNSLRSSSQDLLQIIIFSLLKSSFRLLTLQNSVLDQLLDLLRSQPPLLNAVLPLTIFLFAVTQVIDAHTLLFAIDPNAFVLAPIAPFEDAFTMLLVLGIFLYPYKSPTLIYPSISPSVWPLDAPLPVHLVVFPLALINSLIRPNVHARAFNVVINELP